MEFCMGLKLGLSSKGRTWIEGVFEDSFIRKIIGSERYEVTGVW
jgi:hypothetical protein